MGRHKEWRKIAKRERRRKIRIKQAEDRNKEFINDVSSTEYQIWLKEQERFEIFQREEIERINRMENERWLQADRIAVAQWTQLQEQLEIRKLKRLEQEIRLEKEWENEQIRMKEAKEKLKQFEEETKRRQNLFMEKLEYYLSGNSYEPPEELTVTRETKPDMQPCPFFAKTACCRFGDSCSRNHRYPGISKVLLAPNFYANFGLENLNVTEYEDVILESEDSDTYKEFKEFFYDVLPEFEKYGEVIQFKVCNNFEKHLRGNTYIEFADLRCAVTAYRGLHTRWYAGRQLTLQFCTINSWKTAICGLQISKRCPKGRACNFLHVFRNPTSLYRPNRSIRSRRDYDREKRRSRTARRSQSPESDARERKRSRERNKSWRWSESPEPEVKGRSREKIKSWRWSESPEPKVRQHRKSRETTKSKRKSESPEPQLRKNKNKTSEKHNHGKKNHTPISHAKK